MFDSSILYTNIHIITEFSDRRGDQFCFNGGDKGFIGITRYKAIWTNSQDKYRLPFNKTSLKLVINYLTDNPCCTLGSMRFVN